MILKLFFLSIITPIILLTNSAETQYKRNIDLNGVWYRDDNTMVEITQVGNEITSVHYKLTEIMYYYNFYPGEINFTGKLKDFTIKGKINTHYSPQYMEPCPKNWKFWENVVYTISADGNTMTGKSLVLNLNPVDCSLTESGWETIQTLFRKRQLAYHQ